MDDGVVVRLDDETFLCHTTSGGADRIHAWFEEWLQTEWFDFKVYVANLTEQYSQIAVAGPKALELLRSLDSDIDFVAVPFMGMAEGTIAGCPARVFRISFTGELSYEFAVPLSFGLSLWEKLHAKAEELGGGVYGTEAQHILRAEKGFVVIGDETDGTVTAHDVGMSWAVSKRSAARWRARSREWQSDWPCDLDLLLADAESFDCDGVDQWRAKTVRRGHRNLNREEKIGTSGDLRSCVL